MSGQTLTLPQNSDVPDKKTQLWITAIGGVFCAALLMLAAGFGMKVIPAFLLGAGVIWAVFARPFYGLLLVFFMIFSGAAAGFQIPGGYMAVAAFAILAWVFDRMRTFDLTVFYGKQQGNFIALLLAAFLLSIPFSFNQIVSTLKLVGYVKVIVLYLLVINLLRTEKEFKLVLVVIFATALVSFGYGVYELFFAVKELQTSYIAGKTLERIQGLTYDPNVYASSLLILIPIPFLRFFSEKAVGKKLLWLALFVALVGSLAITFSRGGVVSFAFLMAMLMVKKRHNRYVLWTGLLTVLVIIILLPPDFWQRFSFISNLRNESSANWRFRLATGAFDYFIDHPLFGIGLGCFRFESFRFVPQLNQPAHNMYIEMAAETGIVGLLAFLGIMWITARYYAESRAIFLGRGNPDFALIIEGFRIGYYAFLFSALFLSLQMDTLLWVQFGIAGALRLMAEKSKERSKPDSPQAMTNFD